MNQFEAGILMWVQQHRVSFLDFFNKYITLLNDAGILSIAVTVIFLIIRKFRKYGVVCAISLMIEVILNNITLKPLIDRVRPWVVEPALVVLTHLPDDASFPSGHAGAAFAVAWAMFLVMPKKWGVTAVIVAALISVSRIYVAVHYPTDVMAGIALGIISACIAKAIARRIFRARRRKARRETA